MKKKKYFLKPKTKFIKIIFKKGSSYQFRFLKSDRNYFLEKLIDLN